MIAALSVNLVQQLCWQHIDKWRSIHTNGQQHLREV